MKSYQLAPAVRTEKCYQQFALIVKSVVDSTSFRSEMVNNTTTYNEHCGPLPPDVSSELLKLVMLLLSIVTILGILLVSGLILTNKKLREQVLCKVFTFCH